MKFIILLFALFLQRETKKPDYQRSNAWFLSWVETFNAPGDDKRKQVLIYAATVLLPALLLAGILTVMGGLFWGSIALVLQVALFLYVIGRDDTAHRFEQYLGCWQRHDYEGAYECATEALHIELNVCAPQQLHETIAQGLAYAWFSRLFVLVFWLAVGGVPLALVCLLTYWFKGAKPWPWCASLIAAIEWIPSRLLALTCAVVGAGQGKMQIAISLCSDFTTPAQTVLVRTIIPADGGFSADKAQAQLIEINQLMTRCVLVWLLAVALLTLIGVLA